MGRVSGMEKEKGCQVERRDSAVKIGIGEAVARPLPHTIAGGAYVVTLFVAM